jgi:DNA-binding response OmpR family regulator
MELGTAAFKIKAVSQKVSPVEKSLTGKKRILIIEDEYSASKFLTLRLKNLGFAVTAAFDGMAGLKEASETIPDLIILDLMLPKLPGEEVCKTLRESFDEQLAKIPIIMLTGKDSVVDKVLGKVIGADAYLTKPYDFSDLFEVIKKILPDFNS